VTSGGSGPLDKPGRPGGGQSGNQGSPLTHLWTRLKGWFTRKRQGR
jgi:hypothetical protein